MNAVRFGVASPPKTGRADEDARAFLQRAIELEHATIPPYLTALYSLAPGRNAEIGALLRTVVTQEMAHMTLAANVLSAIGGAPCFTKKTFIPKYPGGLPYHIGGNRFEVPLAPFSIELVEKIFMTIEQPEFPALEFPEPAPGPTDAGADDHVHTVGEFYATIKEMLEAAGPGAFTGRPEDQLVQPYGAFVVTSLEDAGRAIDAIVRQGEGSKQSPLSGPAGELAHYYRFAEIVNGSMLVGDPNSAPLYFSYSGRPVPFDPDGVIPIVTNAKQAMYSQLPQAARISRQFNGQYGSLLRLLEEAYAGRGGEEVNANIVGLMYDMKIVAQRLMAIEIPPATAYGPRRFAAPTFEMEAA